ncbi:hypothetical protein VKT23_000948 [Stygiomarasmius scandens]|uniref:Uncharacterized protein n=1 Tax=Marasmiellus scandens TaxID=2682957 RepID=A0ABR1K5L9_9AGAR
MDQTAHPSAEPSCTTTVHTSNPNVLSSNTTEQVHEGEGTQQDEEMYDASATSPAIAPVPGEPSDPNPTMSTEMEGEPETSIE